MTPALFSVITERQRFLQKLHEQLQFMERSCVAFGTGAEDEAFRLAVSLRIVFHDKGRSTSLVTHLGLRDTQMFTSSRGHGDFKDYLSYRLNLSSDTPVKALPMLGDVFRAISMNQWWQHEPVFVHQGVDYSRRKIVLSAAEKDGGAHVDEQLEEYYKILCAGEFAFGITGNLEYAGTPPFEQGVTHYARNAHLALIRQFAHEALASAKRFQWWAPINAQ